MVTYNKLVRDKIPAIIEKDGLVCKTKQLNEEQFRKEVVLKFYEELEEYTRAQTEEEAKEELADVMELVHTLMELHQINPEQLDTIRQQKNEKCGSFEQKVFLVEVTD